MLDAGLTRATADGRPDPVEPGGRTAPFSRSRSAGGRGAGLPPRPRGFPTGSEFEPGAGVHHRCAPGVDRADDLLGVDPLQVGGAPRGAMRKEMTDDYISSVPAGMPDLG